MAGKFFSDLADPDTLPKIKEKKPPVVKKPRVELTGKKGCKACPLRDCWPTIATRKMEATGNLKSGDILVLGASPSKVDDIEGKPFQHDAAKLLDKLISGRNSKRLVFQNLVRCYEPGHEDQVNVAPAAQASYACSKYLDYDLVDNEIKAIIGIGQAPLSFFWPGAQIWQVYGIKFPVQVNGNLYWYYPVMDPNTILTGKKFKESKWGNPEWDPAYPVIKGDLDKFFKDVDSWPEPKIYPFDKSKVQHCKTEAEVREAMLLLKRPYGVDIETNGLDPLVYGARILTVAFADGERAVAWAIEHRERHNKWGLKLMFEFLRSARWVAHNVGFEWSWFLAQGAELPANFECTQARMRLLHQREMGLSLANATRIYLGVDVKAEHQLDVKRLDDYPVDDVISYNGLDAIACVRVHNIISPFSIKEDPNYDRLMGGVLSTVRMQLLGLPVDLEAEAGLRLVWSDKAEKAAAKIRKIYEVKIYERMNGKPLDISSTKQIAEVLVQHAKIRLPKTEKGNYKTDMATLELVAAGHPLIKRLQEYREATKYQSTYLDPVASVPVLYRDNMLHPSYTTTLTATLRLSGYDPNIQNFPKRRYREFRTVVIPGIGHVLLSIDFGQLEVRILAMVSQDGRLIKSILDGEDMHSFWLNKLLKAYPDYLDKLAQETNETDESKIRKGGRDTIKTHFVFASFYGSTPSSMSERTGIPLPVMQGLAEEFWSIYRGVHRWQKTVREHYKKTGSVRCITGLVRHDVLPGNEIINTPIQHTGAQIVGDARNSLTRMSLDTGDIYLQPRIDVHDDLTFIVPDDDAQIEHYWDKITKEMVKVRYDWQSVPLMVEGKIGYDWATLEEIGKHVGDYVR